MSKGAIWVVIILIIILGVYLIMNGKGNTPNIDSGGAEEGVMMDDETAVEDEVSDDHMTEGVIVTYDIDGRNFSFTPNMLEVKKGDTVKINFTSVEGFHDWTLDEYGVQTERVNTGGSASVTFVANKIGEFEFYCSVGSHRANGMFGTLRVTE